ncbi:hypothetical protein GCM10010365_15050 [Streptomyces poonensis]|uniref:Uncharacterized protein n=1 Tax=Streptomyces poonensis TaxID=68255 RepID=A0A918UEI0_9ACTN|nr:hypothetical protein GCM10010365_15050 [Streptomyces poonensis]
MAQAGLPTAEGRLKQSCEYIVWGTKGPVDSTGTPCTCPASTPRASPGNTACTSRKSPWRSCRICPPGGRSSTPFAGSGTISVAALPEGREFIEVELSEYYADIAERRLRGALFQSDFALAGPGE